MKYKSVRNKLSIGLACVVLGARAFASDQEQVSKPRFGFWAGAGTGLLVASEKSAPFRLNAGIEYYFRSENQIALGYMAAIPFGFDQVEVDGFSGAPFRMAHYFPHFRYFVIPGRLSIQGAVGIAIQHLGSMMSSGMNWDEETVGRSSSFEPSFATHIAAEYHVPLESNVRLGFEGAFDFFTRSSGARHLPRVMTWVFSTNIGFSF